MRINFEIQGGTGIESFRPQQGLPIMNEEFEDLKAENEDLVSVPNRGYLL